MCGGTPTAALRKSHRVGLSPRVRGNRIRPISPSRIIRSIPACAGEPDSAPRPSSVSKVYPRVCGGTRWSSSTGALTDGLSPRVRGNPFTRPLATNATRSIPACAGNPSINPSAVRVTGSIPACAGEPSNQGMRARSSAVYPRVCGGTAGRRNGRRGMTGLSPRVRGEPRIVGARRGMTRVYPRVCGGTLPAAPCPPRQTGLSPRVRGNRDYDLSEAGIGRSIPACAGEPPTGHSKWNLRQVYPRVCGGTSWRVSTKRRAGRSIPACAGEP